MLKILSLSILLFSVAIKAELVRPSPLRRAVDVYNAIGSTNRLIAFMKIGAAPDDLHYLNILAARADHSPLPKAYLAGSVIYFRGLAEPLKVVDLRARRFTIHGRSFELSSKPNIRSLLTGLERVLFPKRSAYFFIDWLLPEAVADVDPGAKAATVAGTLALSGLASGLQCFEGTRDAKCGDQFMGMLAALGEVGGFEGPTAPAQAFCSPGFHGQNKLVVAATRHKLFEVSEAGGEYRIDPGPADPSAGEQRAAATLLEACSSKSALANYNVAFAYPVKAESMRVRRRVTTIYTRPVQLSSGSERATDDRAGAAQ